MLKIEDLRKYFKDAGSPHIGFQGTCHDCGHAVTIDIDWAEDGKLTISGGVLYNPQVGPTPEDRQFFMKCDACFEKDSTLRNYRPTEWYSMVVGYLRPVKDWNEGKKEEFKLRSTFKV